jgi:hypothetical protein
MTSISLTLYIPTGVTSHEISQYLSSTNNISPPFQNKYQDLINERWGNRRDYRMEKFQVDFPRGPVRSYNSTHRASRRSSSLESSIVDRINRAFHAGLSTPLGSRTPRRQNIENIIPSSTSTMEFHCAICLDDCKTGQRQQILPCMHKFHSSCIGSWLSNNNKCPTCRHPVFDEEFTHTPVNTLNNQTSDERILNLVNNIRRI